MHEVRVGFSRIDNALLSNAPMALHTFRSALGHPDLDAVPRGVGAPSLHDASRRRPGDAAHDDPGMARLPHSPDERQIALLHATPTSPAELYVMPAPAEGAAGAAPTRLRRSTTEELRSYPWRAAEIVAFKDADGFDIYADLWKPKTPHPLRPAVVHVHGAGYAQAVFRRWSNTAMFFH